MQQFTSLGLVARIHQRVRISAGVLLFLSLVATAGCNRSNGTSSVLIPPATSDASVWPELRATDPAFYNDFAATFYVAPNGTGQECAASQPCDLDTAKSMVRQRLNPSLSSNILVLLKGGDYRLTAPFVLEPADSGVNGHHVVWKNATGETPVLSSGNTVTGWSQVDAQNNIWAAAVPAGTHFRALYVNGKTARRAWTDYNTSGVVINGNTATTLRYDFTTWRHPEDVEVVRRNLWLYQQCPVSAVQAHSLEMLDSCVNNWTLPSAFQQFGPVFNATEQMPALENAYELLANPGDWYLDPHQGQLYYIPRPGEVLSATANPQAGDAQVVYPSLTSLVQLLGTETTPIQNIAIQGLVFRYTDAVISDYSPYDPSNPATGVKVNAGQNISFTNNLFLNLGRQALHFDVKGDHLLVNGNGFGEIGNTAILLYQFGLDHCCGLDGGTSARNRKMYMSDVDIVNNYTLNTGRIVDGAGAGAGVAYTELMRNLKVLHNEIRNATSNGIAGDWFHTAWLGVTGPVEYGWNRVVNSNSSPYANDTGALYVASLNAAPSSIHDNFVDGMGIGNSVRSFMLYGIYLDLYSEHVDITRNVLKGMPSKPFVSGWLQFTSARNNTAHGNWSDSPMAHDIDITQSSILNDRGYSYLLPVSLSSNPLGGAPNQVCDNTYVLNSQEPVATPGLEYPNNGCDNTYLVNSPWPQESQDVMNAAGLEPEYAAMRTAVNAAVGFQE